MKPLLVLISAFLIAGFSIKLINGSFNFPLSVRIGMTIMLLFTAMGHFIFTNGMEMMIPNFLPFKKELVYFTAIIEIVGALGLHIPQLRVMTAWLLMVFFILILPANIKASIKKLD